MGLVTVPFQIHFAYCHSWHGSFWWNVWSLRFLSLKEAEKRLPLKHAELKADVWCVELKIPKLRSWADAEARCVRELAASQAWFSMALGALLHVGLSITWTCHIRTTRFVWGQLRHFTGLVDGKITVGNLNLLSVPSCYNHQLWRQGFELAICFCGNILGQPDPQVEKTGMAGGWSYSGGGGVRQLWRSEGVRWSEGLLVCLLFVLRLRSGDRPILVWITIS